jgi:hypothetical protein
MVQVAFKPFDTINGSSTLPQVPQLIKSSSLNDFLALRGELIQVFSENALAGVNATLYQVPEDYIFFITSANMSSGQNAIWGADVSWSIYLYVHYYSGVGGAKAILVNRINAQNGVFNPNTISNSMNPVIPLAITSGAKIYIYQQASLINTSVAVQGYLIKKSDLPQTY